MDAGSPMPRLDRAVLTPPVQRALGSATVAVTDWAASPVSGGAGSLGVEASGVYRVGGYGRDQGRTVPWSLILKVAASSAHGGDPDGGARERHAYRSGLLGDLPGGLVAPRCLGAVAQPDGALWTWLEEIRESDGPHWRLARYGLAARHLGQFNGAYLTGRSPPSRPWLSTGWLRIQAIGALLLRYGLVLVIGWIGAMKFTAYEAAGIQPLVSSSPLMRWLYQYLSVQAVSTLLGLVEITIAVLIAMRPVAAKVSGLGSALAVLMFLTTLSFLVSLPGWEPTLGGFPALSGSGGFLLKDIMLLAAAVWSLGEALQQVQ